MKVFLALLFVACAMATDEPVVGGWSAVKTPTFPKDNPAVLLVTKLDTEIKALLEAKYPDDPSIKTDTITVNAYRTQIVEGTNYDVLIGLKKGTFSVEIYSPLTGSPKVTKLEGPLLKDTPLVS